MRTPPHLPGRTRHESRDTDTVRPRRHPYALHEVPVQSPPRASSGTLDLPDALPETDPFVEQRLLGIREMSNQAIGSIDDLLQHTA
ncbi:hypothetical protein ETD86_06725 [Nonomuraea turkmeniaca]|uniref:Uncharacterized protein n=1 Tax=Nonomuraea turkmeniaca TaxID=103838 RepID=A0A5S4FUP2_9ACTN|nr:hypothetical protein [Nonomuraea turkmeniaca]TMR23841.1 hypothetical protein ETD86_06725 [Nonomuraea turkmeniaca]